MSLHPQITREASAATLRKGQLLALAGRSGLRIDCREGSLWITQDRDPVDVVLEAGQSHVLAGDERVLVQALAPARLVVRPPLRPAGAGWVARLQRRWPGWLGGQMLSGSAH
ncbi:DUF2917 domain-containing protein [Rivibacter subsaxonicus]|uniref:DUF2917 family protein n=1 Tax=Rivibacter subsaxonicus TaxID=457575 RepID=A0A4Q7VGZ3_9BURK|nr:DUF2917 domain-containing protein [Rivibacter subsaxonicus]RZT95294.1 DUF2917 family protein [Rivibacter subsaxonicus]